MTTSDAFVRRLPGEPVPKELQQLVLGALNFFIDNPRSRSTYWYFVMQGRPTYSLLGMVCKSLGLDLEEIPRSDQQLVCSETLRAAGFDVYQRLAIEEIDSHSFDTSVLEERLLEYMECGARMPFTDGFVEVDRQRRAER